MTKYMRKITYELYWNSEFDFQEYIEIKKDELRTGEKTMIDGFPYKLIDVEYMREELYTKVVLISDIVPG